ncbi:hypothetical protein RSAG8_09051, partial [Rhizoctonia solani AG-8 WAC10335]
MSHHSTGHRLQWVECAHQAPDFTSPFLPSFRFMSYKNLGSNVFAILGPIEYMFAR